MFSPPFVPPRPESARYSRRPSAPITYEPAPLPPEERSAPRVTPPVFTRTPDAPLEAPAAPPPAPFIRQLPGALPPAHRPLELTAGAPPQPGTIPPAPVAEPDSELELELTHDMLVDEGGLPWEYSAMTTPDYTPSIHDPEHDSWPVPAPPGDAVPAWADHDDDTQLEPDDAIGNGADSDPAPIAEAGPAEADEVDEQEDLDAPPIPTDADEYLTPDGGDGSFPLDAFIVPTNVAHAPAGYFDEVGSLVAERLEELAREIRGNGIGSVGHAGSVDELSRVLGAIVTGYLARRG